MSAPLIWIILPGLAAILFFVLSRYERYIALTGTAIALLLAGLAWMLPLAAPLHLGPLNIEVANELTILGRRFVLTNTDRSTLASIYLMAAFWFGGAYAIKVGQMFIPMGLGVVSLMTAALAVEPFLYAALLITMAVLLCVPILSSPGKPVNRGTLRFLTFQSLGAPFILLTGLFTGWMSTPSSAAPAEADLVMRTILLLALGFAFWLAIFPFHSWAPMLAEETHPYAAGFVFFMVPGMVSLFGLSFLVRFDWLRSEPLVFTLLQFSGVLMIAAGGLLTAFQHSLGRMLGYAVLADIGFTLLAAGLLNQAAITAGASNTIFFGLFLSRALGLGAWAFALSNIRSQTGNLEFRNIQGIGRRMPFTAAALLLGQFSLAGFPLLAGFPSRLILWGDLARLSPLLALWALAGSAGLLIGGMRSLATLLMGTEESRWRVSETNTHLFFLTAIMAAIVLAGIYPPW